MLRQQQQVSLVLRGDRLRDEQLGALLGHLAKNPLVSRCSLDGFQASMKPSSWAHLGAALAASPCLREVLISSVLLDEQTVEVFANLIASAPLLVDVAFDKCSLASPLLLQNLGDAVASNRNVRKFAYTSKESFSKSEVRVIFQVFCRSFSLLMLTLPASFEKYSEVMTVMLAQNHKIGLHLEKPSPIVVLSQRLFTTLPHGFCSLFAEVVTSLDLSQNQLRMLPPSMSDFVSLVNLDLSQNQLTDFPLFLSSLEKLKTVSLLGNPILGAVPGSIAHDDFRALCAHFLSLRNETLLCSEIRVAVLGDPGSGKTSLCRALTSRLRNPRKSTILSRLRDSSVDGPSSPNASEGDFENVFGSPDLEVYDMMDGEEQDFTLRLWDFSATLMTTNAFQFFVTGQLLFIIVFNVLSDDPRLEVEEWLSSIEGLPFKPNVLLVATHRDKAPNGAAVAQQVFDGVKRRKKSNVSGMVWVDVFKESTLSDIRPKLRKMAVDAEGFTFLGSSFSKSYYMMRAAIKAEANELVTPVLSRARFLQLASHFGIKAGAQAEEALRFLHHSGKVIYFGDIPELADRIVIDPLWLVRIMHTLVNSEKVARSGAAFLKSNMNDIWPVQRFPPQSWPVMLQFLYEFEIIHDLRSSKSWSACVVPCLLTSVKSSYGEDKGFSNFMESFSNVVSVSRTFRFDNLPRMLRTKILVRFLDVTDVHASIWANGVVCGVREAGGGTATLLAQWVQGSVSELKMVVVSRSRKSSAQYTHVFTRVLETLLLTWYSSIHFETLASGPSGTLYPINKLVGEFLRGVPAQEKLMSNVAPDLCLDQAPLVDWDDLKKVRDLGAGSFGTVELFEYQGRQVVVKKLIMVGDESDETEAISLYLDFLRECWMMYLLDHPNVIKLTGVCTKPLAMVLEFCKGLDLRYFLDTHDDASVSWTIKLSLLRDVAQGMNAANQTFPRIIHRDLKSPNVFIQLGGDRGIQAQVADLGCATFLAKNCKATAVDNPTWSAPELIKGDLITEKADVFSFGIIMWEMLTCKFPYDDLMAEYQFTSRLCDAIVQWKVRPTIPKELSEHVPPTYVGLMERCWLEDPTKRPSFYEVLGELAAMQAQTEGDALNYELEKYGTLELVAASVCVCWCGRYLYALMESDELSSRGSTRIDVYDTATGGYLTSHPLSQHGDESSDSLRIRTVMVNVNGACWVIVRDRPDVLVFKGTDMCLSFRPVSMKAVLTGLSAGENGVWLIGRAKQPKRNIVAVLFDPVRLSEVPGKMVYFNIGGFFKATLSADCSKLYAIVYDDAVVSNSEDSGDEGPPSEPASPSRKYQLLALRSAGLTTLNAELSLDELSDVMDGQEGGGSYRPLRRRSLAPDLGSASSAAASERGAHLAGRRKSMSASPLATPSPSGTPRSSFCSSDHVTFIPADKSKMFCVDLDALDVTELKPIGVTDGTVMDLVGVKDEVWVLLGSGLLLIVDPSTCKIKYSVEVDNDGALCDLKLLAHGRFCAVISRQKLFVLPTWYERRADCGERKMSVDLVNNPVIMAQDAMHNESLFFTHGREQKKLQRWHLRPCRVPGVDDIKEVDRARQLSEVETAEKLKKEGNLVAFKQQRGLMLNLDEVNYTESSKPMGLDLNLDDELEHAASKVEKPLLMSSSGSLEGKRAGFLSPFRKSSKDKTNSRKKSTSGTTATSPKAAKSPAMSHKSPSGSRK